MSNIPARVQSIINEIADRHEVSADDVLSRNSTRAVELARLECYRVLLEAPKPTGLRPTKAEVARWFNRDGWTISSALQDRQTAIELLEDAKL